MLFDAEIKTDIDLGSLQQRLKNADVTTLNIGTSSSGTSVSLVDGNLLRSCLVACLAINSMQAAKLEEYDAILSKFQNADVGELKGRLSKAEGMIKNLAHNIQGYVDPEDGLGAAQELGGMLDTNRRSSDPCIAKVPGNFLEATTRAPLPISSKVEKDKLTLNATEAEANSEVGRGTKEGGGGAALALPTVRPSMTRPMSADAANHFERADEKKEPDEDNSWDQSKGGGAAEAEPKPKLVPSPPGGKAAERDSSPNAEAATLSTNDNASSNSSSSSSKTDAAQASSRSSLVRRRFKRAQKAIAFTTNLQKLHRTSMLRARAPKEFSVLERVSRLEEKLSDFTDNWLIYKDEQEGKMKALEESIKKGWVFETIRALGRRLQCIEVAVKKAGEHSDLSEQLSQGLKKVHAALAAHIENTENITEENTLGRLVSLQQRIVETTNSYQSLAADLTKIKIPDSNDEMRPFKILQFQSRLQGIRHRLTHLDAEHMVETVSFNRMKQASELMEKHNIHVSDQITEIYSSVQEKVDTCVNLNLELWDKLTSIDKAAGNAWGIIGRLFFQGGNAVDGLKDGAPLHSHAEKGSESQVPSSSPINASSQRKKGSAHFRSFDFINAVNEIMDARQEPFADSRSHGSVNLSEAVKTLEKKLAAASTQLEELASQNQILQHQLNEKADNDAVQSALRVSRLAQASVEGKADAIALDNMEAFLQKCRKEVVKLRTSQEAGIAGTRRILERKLKRVMKETAELQVTQSQNQNAFIGAGKIAFSSRSSLIEKNVKWKADNGKFIPAHPAVTRGEPVVVTKGNFLMGLPGGVKGRVTAEDPPRTIDAEPLSESLGKMIISSNVAKKEEKYKAGEEEGEHEKEEARRNWMGEGGAEGGGGG